MAYRARVLVTGAGGFIGHHLVRSLVERGYWVRGVDIVPPAFEASPAHAFEILDPRRWDSCLLATRGIDEVYNLAANMGGIGFSTWPTGMRNQVHQRHFIGPFITARAINRPDDADGAAGWNM